jgi:hypothetical protein
MRRSKRKMLPGEAYDLLSCKISKCGKNRLLFVFLTAVGRLETEVDEIYLCTFTPLRGATLQTDFEIPKKVQFEWRFFS